MDIKEQIENIISVKNLSVEELAEEVGISASVLRNALKGKGSVSKYGKEKIEKYCEENGISAGQPDADYIKEVGNALKEFISVNLDVEPDADFSDDSVTVGAPLDLSALDCGAYVSILCPANKSMLIYIQFGTIEATFEAYELINRFNLSQPIFRAVINEENRLELQCSVLETSGTEKVVDTVGLVLTCLCMETYEDLLRPIARLIK